MGVFPEVEFLNPRWAAPMALTSKDRSSQQPGTGDTPQAAPFFGDGRLLPCSTTSRRSPLHAALTGLSKRQRVTADNIANIETPGFLAGRVDFESALCRARRNGRRRRPTATATVARSLEPTRTNGNNVNLDEETLVATDTGLRYQLALQRAGRQVQPAAHGDQGSLTMSIFDALGIAGSGVTVYRKWLDAVSDNIANINDVTPTDQQRVPGPVRRSPRRSTTARATGGVQVAGVAFGSAEGRLVYEPDNPLADTDGLRALPGHRPRRAR